MIAIPELNFMVLPVHCTLKKEASKSCTEVELCVVFPIKYSSKLEQFLLWTSLYLALVQAFFEEYFLLAEDKHITHTNKENCKWSYFSVYISGKIDASLYTLVKNISLDWLQKNKISMIICYENSKFTRWLFQMECYASLWRKQGMRHGVLFWKAVSRTSHSASFEWTAGQYHPRKFFWWRRPYIL